MLGFTYIDGWLVGCTGLAVAVAVALVMQSRTTLHIYLSMKHRW
jgi:hypothetical protein